jgi:outer membrane protein assembly factor BamB
MANPDTKEEPGEGFVAVNPATGAIIYKDYFELMYNTSWSAAGNGVVPFTPEPVYVDNVAYCSGNGRVIAFDLNTGKRLWTVQKELKEGYPTDIAVIDGVVYVKFGKDMVTPTLKENKLKVESPWEMDPHGFAAIDAASGKFLWKKDLEEDPGRFLPQFTIMNYYNPAMKQLYFSNEEKIFALALRRDGGGYDWELGLDKAKIGEMPVKKVYAINESWIGSVRRSTTTTYNYGGGFSYSYTTTSGGMNAEKEASFLEDAAGSELSTTYTSWGNIWGVTAKRCLRVLFDSKHLLIYGTDGIGLIDVAAGKPAWVTEWDYDYEAVQYIPRVLNGKVVYCVDRMMTSLDLKTGKQDWQAKEAKKPRFFVSPDERFIFSIDDEVIKGYELK